MTLLLACGCQMPFRDDGREIVCVEHGAQRVLRTLGMRAPTFRGSVRGPHARSEDLGEHRGRFVDVPPLVRESHGQ